MEYKQGLNLNLQGKIGTIKFLDEDGILFESGNETEFIPFNVLEELQPVSTGEIVKLQKPNEESFTDVEADTDGDMIGNCSECGQSKVSIKDHVCQTLLELPQIESHEHVPSYEAYHKIKEAITTFVNFEDTQIDRLKKLWNMQHIKYHNNTFFSSIIKQLEDKKKLTQKQFDELKYLLDNGRSKYEAGILSTKN